MKDFLYGLVDAISPTEPMHLRRARRVLKKIAGYQPDMAGLSDEGLRLRAATLRLAVEKGRSLPETLPEAYALLGEAVWRALGLRAHDEQLIGAVLLNQGHVVEMRTGEGKTLTALFPAFLRALEGKGVHLVTVNDYLAARDAVQANLVLERLDMRCEAVTSELGTHERRQAYAADITYATSRELAFDYLRDGLVTHRADMVQRAPHFALIDEVDSILIDEARTPLIISQADGPRSGLCTQMAQIMGQTTPDDVTIDARQRSLSLSDAGETRIEALLNDAGLLPENTSLQDHGQEMILHHTLQALRARFLFECDRDYLIRDGKVMLVDEFTGRVSDGRKLSDGLHQAIEAAEGLEITSENRSMASISFQSYFRLYPGLCGMTGTAMTEADEFRDIYHLKAVSVPTHLPVIRRDERDRLYRTSQERDTAVVAEIARAHAAGQPVLVGTTSIAKSEALAARLAREGIRCEILNARHHLHEARIVAQAGRAGAVTIATSMAGRGTDIPLGGSVSMRLEQAMTEQPGNDNEVVRAGITAEVAAERERVLAAGGLYVIGTERHESRRIDNQLRGRSGRQGDPGCSAFFLSLEDDLLRNFTGAGFSGMLDRLGAAPGVAIVSPAIDRVVASAQGWFESRNFSTRKQVLQFDTVMTGQSQALLTERFTIIDAENVRDIVTGMRHALIDELVETHVEHGAFPDQWDLASLAQGLAQHLGLVLPLSEWAEEDGVDRDKILERIMVASDGAMEAKRAEFGDPIMDQLEHEVLLGTLDRVWIDHVAVMDGLRQSVGMRGYAQRDPIQEYQTDGLAAFERMIDRFRNETVSTLSRMRALYGQDLDALEDRASLAATNS